MEYSNIPRIPKANHRADCVNIGELAAGRANGRGVRVPNNANVSRNEDGVCDDIGAGRKVNNFAVTILSQNIVDVLCVIGHAIAIYWFIRNGFDIEDLFDRKFAICRRRHYEIVLPTHQKVGYSFGHHSLAFHVVFIGVASGVLEIC